MTAPDKTALLVERLRDASAHSAESYGCEEYLPMASFWQSYAALSAEAATLLLEQQEENKALREAIEEAYEFLGGVNGAVLVREKILAALSKP